MEQQIHITLASDLATGTVNLNEIVYRSSNTDILEMIKVFKEHGYYKGSAYLENLSRRNFYQFCILAANRRYCP